MTSQRTTSEQSVGTPSRAPWIIAILLALIAGMLIGLLSGGVQIYINDESHVVQTPAVTKPEQASPLIRGEFSLRSSFRRSFSTGC